MLAALLAKGLSCAVARKDNDLVVRLSTAAALVLGEAIEPTESPAIMAVRSASSPGTWYEVTGTVCTCQDWTCAAKKGESRPSKHGLAVALWLRLAQSDAVEV